MTTTTAPEVSAGAASERIFAAFLGGLEAFSIYLGQQLGWYTTLRDAGPLTAGELAERTGSAERYAREWLEQQAVMGLITVDRDGPPEQRRFVLPAGAAEALTDTDSLAFMGAAPGFLAAAAAQLPTLLHAYRSGQGVSWEQLGTDARQAQADLNRPWFLHALPGALRSVPDLDALLRRPGARILDVGCGAGWSTLALARAYPEASVVGIDVDAASVQMAEEQAAAAGTNGQVQFRLADAGSLADAADGAGYDAAFAFECVHDMARPVEVLSAVRRSLRPDGVLVVMDEAVADEFTAPGDELERYMYGISLLVCLPDGLSSTPSVATGTVIRRSTLERYAREAGFGSVELLPIEDFSFFRFYRITP